MGVAGSMQEASGAAGRINILFDLNIDDKGTSHLHADKIK